MVGILDDTDKGAKLMLQVMSAGTLAKEQIQSRQLDLGKLSEAQEAGLRDKLKEWLQKGLKLAKEFSPSMYSVSISVPMVGSISFSWSLQGED
jgi:hypothetical protein